MTKDGGPAFPQSGAILDHGDTILPPLPGMSLRDWFAGQALAGMTTNPDPRGTPARTAEWAYAYADAMLAARETNHD